MVDNTIIRVDIYSIWFVSRDEYTIFLERKKSERLFSLETRIGMEQSHQFKRSIFALIQ